MKRVTVTTHANIALNKYWGKRNEELILPTKSSLAVNVAALTTTTTASFSSTSNHVITTAWNNHDTAAQKSITTFLDLFKQRYGVTDFFTIKTENNFGQKSGLASSASGFAALTLAITQLCNLHLPEEELSILARQGSGSACRSLRGGFVLWHKGVADDGSDSFAQQLATATFWPEFRVIIAVINEQEKVIGSRAGMAASVATAPGYAQWLNASAERLEDMIQALNRRDINELGRHTEADWHDMHNIMVTTTPSLNYWLPASHTLMQEIINLRTLGIPA